jgi:hypothetical protein
MTPDVSAVICAHPDSTIVRLADSKGSISLPLSTDKEVPGLHEPLLLVDGMCDKGLVVVFSADSCDIYDGPSFSSTGSAVGRGYQKGNLFYLLSDKVRSSSTSHGCSLLGYLT